MEKEEINKLKTNEIEKKAHHVHALHEQITELVVFNNDDAEG